MEFKVGDKILCIDDTDFMTKLQYIKKGKVYIVKEVNKAGRITTTERENSSYFPKRFIKAHKLALTMYGEI